MKKYLYVVLLSVLVLALAACGTKNDADGKNASGGNGKEETKIVVGASNTPHAIILEKAQPILKEKGIDLVIETYQDYVLPNKDLESGQSRCKLFPTHSIFRFTNRGSWL